VGVHYNFSWSAGAQRVWRAAAAGLLAVLFSVAAQASTSGVVISQVYGGGGNSTPNGPFASDYVELFNAGSAAVTITGWSVQYASATGTGSFSNGLTVIGSVTLQAGQYHLVRLGTNATGGGAAIAADTNGTNTNISGSNGKVILANVSTGLACNGSLTNPCNATQLSQIVDLVGYGSANYSEGAAAPAPSASTALFRVAGGCTDTDQNNTNFATGTPAPRNSATALAPCGGPPPVGLIVASCPATVSVAAGTASSTVLTASDSDSIVNNATLTSSPVSGINLDTFVASPSVASNASVNLSVASTTAAGTYPVVVNFTNGDGQNTSCNISVSVVTAGAFTPIYDIQGSGPTAALLGVRTTQGVVTKVNNNGYYLQDEVGDGNPLTSDGIFVFTSTAPGVSVGQKLQITGTVVEFDVSLTGANPVAEANPLTEFTNITSTVVLGTGSITPTVVTLPVANAGDLERYEGMLVTLTGPLTASQNFFQGRYGQVTLSAGGRLFKPTNLHRPGTPAALALANLNARSTVLLDDGFSTQNPNPTPYIGADNTLRAGDTVASVTGVIDYGLATNSTTSLTLYRIQPTSAPVFTRANARTAPPVVGGNVKVASFNVLNFFTTFTDGNTAGGATGRTCVTGQSASSSCRGASNLAEFVRQRDKIVAAMAAINADVFGLMEIQNNEALNGETADTAAQNLVAALNTVVGSGSYAVVPKPAFTGTDAIRVAMIYKPATVALSGLPMSDTDAIHNRPPFAHAFTANGQKFSVLVNHFKSKGSCPTSGVDDDQGDGQGCWNDRRKQQSTALLSFIASVQAAAADNDVVVIGDLNAYGLEDPIDVLTTGGLVNQISRFDAAGYSYVFDGEAGYLDHALATPSLSAQIVGTAVWHVNADEPSIIDYNTEFKFPDTQCTSTCPPDLYSAIAYRSSDHDPVIVGLNLQPPQTAQTISFFAPSDRAVNAGSFFVTASASSGLTVTLASGTPAVCAVNGAGQVSLLSVGLCTLNANQAGNVSFAAAPQVTRSFNVTAALLVQSINFNSLADSTVGAAPFAIAASATSGLAVGFSSLTGTVCSVAGSTVTVLAVGTCTIAANQAGNASYLPAPQVTQSFVVSASSVDADIPTLPQWGAILMGLTLLATGLRRRQRPGA
jgi:predicted extracellular nuclease